VSFACEELEFIKRRMEELEKEKLERIRMAPIEDEKAEANSGPTIPLVWPYTYPGYP